MMFKLRAAVILFWMGVLGLGAGGVSGQAYPNKLIRIITSEAGGGSDFLTRLVAQGLGGSLGQVIVENRSSEIIGQLTARATPDGYTLLLHGSVIWIAPLMRSSVPYDPVRDLAPISLVAIAPTILVAHPSLPVKSVREVIALAKASPGALNYASTGAGSGQHLAGELFKSMAGVDIVNIPYKGGGPAITGLLGGEVKLMFASAASVAPHIKSGRLNALAVTAAQPSALFPGLPTVAASGLPGYEAVSIYGVWAPARTPAAILERLNQEVVRVLGQADVKEKMLGSGVESAPSSTERFAAVMASEMAKWGKVIKDAGIRLD